MKYILRLQVIDLGNTIVPSLLEAYSDTAISLRRRALRSSDSSDSDSDEECSHSELADGTAIASLSYRAPEVMACVLPFTAAIDMWALGVSLIEVRVHVRIYMCGGVSHCVPADVDG